MSLMPGLISSTLTEIEGPFDGSAFGKIEKEMTSGWPRHRENREFGSYFFQTGKIQGILL